MKYLTAIVLAVVMLAIPFGSAFTALDLPASTILIKSGPTVIPTFVITAVEKDQWVEIQTDNFPAGDHFNVTMGPMGSKGINGIVIGTTYSGPGGRFTMKYDIPPALKGSSQIAIRLESPTSNYYAYNWFYNSNTNVPTTAVMVTTRPALFPAPALQSSAASQKNTGGFSAYCLPFNRGST